VAIQIARRQSRTAAHERNQRPPNAHGWGAAGEPSIDGERASVSEERPLAPPHFDKTFAAVVLRCVRMIPHGHVATYGQIAALAGRARAARAVGRVMRGCPPGVPWHRVINHQGGISKRANASGMLTQRVLLLGEGIRLRRGRVPLDRYRWDAPARGRSTNGRRKESR